MSPAFQATLTFATERPSIGLGLRRPAPGAAWLRRLMRPAGGAAFESADRSTGLYDRAGLFAAVDAELGYCSAGEPVSAIVLEFPELREVREIYGAAVARKVIGKTVRRLRAVAGRRGLAGRTGPAQFTIVFPGCKEARALRQLQRALGKPARVEFDAGDSEIVLVPEFVIDATSVGEEPVHVLYSEMARDLARMQKDEHRRLNYLTSERERHSRPMAIRA